MLIWCDIFYCSSYNYIYKTQYLHYYCESLYQKILLLIWLHIGNEDISVLLMYFMKIVEWRNSFFSLCLVTTIANRVDTKSIKKKCIVNWFVPLLLIPMTLTRLTVHPLFPPKAILLHFLQNWLKLKTKHISFPRQYG